MSKPKIKLSLKMVPEHVRSVVRESMKQQRPLEHRSVKEEEIYGALETFLSELGRESMPNAVVAVSCVVYVDDDIYLSLSVSSQEKAETETTDAANSAEPSPE